MQWVWGSNEGVRLGISGEQLDVEMEHLLAMLEVGCISTCQSEDPRLPQCRNGAQKLSRVANAICIYFQWWPTAAITCSGHVDFNPVLIRNLTQVLVSSFQVSSPWAHSCHPLRRCILAKVCSQDQIPPLTIHALNTVQGQRVAKTKKKGKKKKAWNRA